MNNKEKFDRYSDMLHNWAKRMNLVAPSTLNDIQHRHIEDSAQLADFLPADAEVFDMGSGAGFPAIVLAILGWKVTCIESIGKKVTFLTAVKDELDLKNLTIYHGRLEDFIRDLPAKNTNFVFTARAFAPLIKIFDYLSAVKCRLFLLKGREIESEIMVAKQKYSFKYKLIPSKTGDGFVTIIEKDR